LVAEKGKIIMSPLLLPETEEAVAVEAILGEAEPEPLTKEMTVVDTPAPAALRGTRTTLTLEEAVLEEPEAAELVAVMEERAGLMMKDGWTETLLDLIVVTSPEEAAVPATQMQVLAVMAVAEMEEMPLRGRMAKPTPAVVVEVAVNLPADWGQQGMTVAQVVRVN